MRIELTLEEAHRKQIKKKKNKTESHCLHIKDINKNHRTHEGHENLNSNGKKQERQSDLAHTIMDYGVQKDSYRGTKMTLHWWLFEI